MPSLKNQQANGYLAVDGVIVAGNDSTIIQLNRTVPVSDTSQIQVEDGAQVQVVGQQGDTYPLVPIGSGRYFSGGLNLNPGQKYRLTIATADGKQYASDFTEVRQTPPIDSVRWYQDENFNANIDVSSHDATNNTRYYRWEYEETWVFHARTGSISDWVNHQETLRQQQIFFCYPTEKSTSINVYSTKKLADDVTGFVHVAQVPNMAEKMEYKYSILVKQYSLTKEAYDFWTAMKTNTEQLGSLFDPQPGQAPTNIHCISDSSVPAIGYISVATLQTKRIFINNSELLHWSVDPYYEAYDNECKSRLVMPDSMDYFFPANGTRYYGITGRPMFGPGFFIQGIICVDCREHIRSPVEKPSFWP